MNSIEIPLPEFGFDEIAKEKAKYIIKNVFHANGLFQYIIGGNNGLELRLQNEVLTLFGNYERLICIAELLNFLIVDEQEKMGTTTFSSLTGSRVSTGFNKLRYVLYALANTSADYSFDKNTFTFEEVANLNSKIDEILFSLNKMQVGQEILYDGFEEVKDKIFKEFKDLKNAIPLGKKTLYQLTIGKIASFTGDKVADEIFKVLEPHIVALFILNFPHLAEGFQKLIS